MNTPQPTRTPRAAAAIHGARNARQRIAIRAEFVRIMAAQLATIAPGTVRVAVAPVAVEDRTRTWVELIDHDGRAVAADRDAHRAAHGLLTRAFPAADWSVPRVYDARTGDLTVNHLAAPVALGLDDVEDVDPYADMTTADVMDASEMYEHDQATEHALDAEAGQ